MLGKITFFTHTFNIFLSTFIFTKQNKIEEKIYIILYSFPIKTQKLYEVLIIIYNVTLKPITITFIYIYKE